MCWLCWLYVADWFGGCIGCGLIIVVDAVVLYVVCLVMMFVGSLLVICGLLVVVMVWILDLC